MISVTLTLISLCDEPVDGTDSWNLVLKLFTQGPIVSSLKRERDEEGGGGGRE